MARCLLTLVQSCGNVALNLLRRSSHNLTGMLRNTENVYLEHDIACLDDHPLGHVSKPPSGVTIMRDSELRISVLQGVPGTLRTSLVESESEQVLETAPVMAFDNITTRFPSWKGTVWFCLNNVVKTTPQMRWRSHHLPYRQCETFFGISSLSLTLSLLPKRDTFRRRKETEVKRANDRNFVLEI